MRIFIRPKHGMVYVVHIAMGMPTIFHYMWDKVVQVKPDTYPRIRKGGIKNECRRLRKVMPNIGSLHAERAKNPEGSLTNSAFHNSSSQIDEFFWNSQAGMICAATRFQRTSFNEVCSCHWKESSQRIARHRMFCPCSVVRYGIVPDAREPSCRVMVLWNIGILGESQERIGLIRLILMVPGY